MPGGQDVLVRELTTEGLLGLTIDGEHRPLLAESWTISDDGLTVSIRLREGVTFHDGAPLSAKIVAEFLDSARVDPRQLQNHPALADIASSETLGPVRLQLHFSRPSALIEDALSLGIERHESELLSGTGPFALSNETEGQITFVANRDYHGGPPAVDVVTLTNYQNHRSAWVAMMRNEIDFLYEVPASEWDFVEAESTVDLYSVARPYAVTVAFNMRQPPPSDTAVRQALNHGVDRRAVIEHALAADSRPVSGVWSQHWAYGGVERVYRYDPLVADEMLTRAGFIHLGAGQHLTHPITKRSR